MLLNNNSGTAIALALVLILSLASGINGIRPRATRRSTTRYPTTKPTTVPEWTTTRFSSTTDKATTKAPILELAKYIVSINDTSGKFICNGVIIKNDRILTAAHCLYDM